MGHVVLVGDSIFDNARYVPDRSPVIHQLRQTLPPGWIASLLAVDGNITADVATQLKKLPSDTTHLVVSVGGNDALSASSILSAMTLTVGAALSRIHKIHTDFQSSYRAMLRSLSTVGKPTAVCSIYDTIPGLGAAEQAALGGFNEVIFREAFLAGMPVIDLRVMFDQPSDYSPISPIEPSELGGAKIVRAIAEIVTTHDFESRRSMIYL
ncbi:lipase [Neosynechococcus sphagnicola sy1]|uniref:Lipase n=1 Tax=Neosynechococcus sphagnicola sy1 TaxID=1497020 RepID=A0A098TNN1_9CYAN|nr:SGNH/GDSL hydrolase family protein [Neosynechococcus sphagnicola]KGF72443.1 lipase [Neosynechococcus sphagnicola sy1]